MTELYPNSNNAVSVRTFNHPYISTLLFFTTMSSFSNRLPQENTNIFVLLISKLFTFYFVDLSLIDLQKAQIDSLINTLIFLQYTLIVQDV